jgi:putative ABC transport system permease protein
MMAADGATPVLVSVKAVDSRVYPFYGTVKLDPARPLSEALTPAIIAVSDDLLVRFNLSSGAAIRLGSADFTVGGVVRLEPDRMAGSLNVGPRVLVTREGLDRTGLMTFGSRASHRLLFKLPPRGVGVAEMRDALRKAFPEAMVADYREGHPFITRALERSTTFLSLVSLIALIVGALGVATAIHSHLQQRLDTIAILKCLGARSAQIIRIYTLQTLLLGLAGGLAGVAVGAVVQALFPLLLTRYFHFDRIPWSPTFAIEGIAAGVLVTMLFTIPPLWPSARSSADLTARNGGGDPGSPSVCNRTPSLISGGHSGRHLRRAGWLAESARMGAYFVGAGVALLTLAGALAASARAASVPAMVSGAPAGRAPPSVANLYARRPRSAFWFPSASGLFTLTICSAESLLVDVAGAAPPARPTSTSSTSRRGSGAIAVSRATSEPSRAGRWFRAPAAVDGSPSGRSSSRAAAIQPCQVAQGRNRGRGHSDRRAW